MPSFCGPVSNPSSITVCIQHYTGIEWGIQCAGIINQPYIPVSQVRDIKIAMSGDTTPTTKINKEDGIVSWTVTLRPRSKKEIILGYTILVPKSYVVTGY